MDGVIHEICTNTQDLIFLKLLCEIINLSETTWCTCRYFSFLHSKSLLRLPVGRGGVINSPFLFFFHPKRGYSSWVISLCTLLSKPVPLRLLNSISSKLCHQNTQFNMYTITSKQQEGSTYKDSYPKCFITTNLYIDCWRIHIARDPK